MNRAQAETTVRDNQHLMGREIEDHGRIFRIFIAPSSQDDMYSISNRVLSNSDYEEYLTNVQEFSVFVMMDGDHKFYTTLDVVLPLID